MAYSVLQVRDKKNSLDYREFICDDSSELENLPTCAVGSLALVIEPVSVHILGNDKQWHQL